MSLFWFCRSNSNQKKVHFKFKSKESYEKEFIANTTIYILMRFKKKTR